MKSSRLRKGFSVSDSKAPADLIGYRIRRLAALLDQHGKLLARRGLGMAHAEWRLIFTLRLRGPSNPHAAASEAGLERSHVSQAVGELSRRGMIERLPDPADGRRVLLQLTDRGLAVYEQGMANSEDRRRMLWGSLTHEERRVFDRALTKLTDEANRLVAEGRALPRRTPDRPDVARRARVPRRRRARTPLKR